MAIPLPILLTIIAIGIAGALIFTHLVGWSKPAQIADYQAALARFQLDYPEAEPGHSWVAEDGSAALLELDDDIGMVFVLGDQMVVRRLGPGSLASVRTDPTHTHLMLRDPGFPHARLPMPASDERQAWLTRLTTCVQAIPA